MEPDQPQPLDAEMVAAELAKLCVKLIIRVSPRDAEADVFPDLWKLADRSFPETWRKKPSATLETMITSATDGLDGSFGAITKKEAALWLFNLDGGEQFPTIKKRSLAYLRGGKSETQKLYDYIREELLNEALLSGEPTADEKVTDLRRMVAEDLVCASMAHRLPRRMSNNRISHH